jgi:hypothetical protein
MTELREETLIKKGFWYFIFPSFILGILGAFIPEIYMILPVHETDICLCSFAKDSRTNVIGKILLTDNFDAFKLVSIITFLVFNWIFLTTLLIKIYRIRHIHDETLIKRECAVILGVWILFSIAQYIFFLLSQKQLCKCDTDFDASRYKIINLATYIIIILRDGITYLITIYFS